MTEDELKKLLNTTAYIELNCANSGCFSFSIAGKCISVTADCTQNHGYLEYTIEDDQEQNLTSKVNTE